MYNAITKRYLLATDHLYVTADLRTEMTVSNCRLTFKLSFDRIMHDSCKKIDDFLTEMSTFQILTRTRLEFRSVFASNAKNVG